MTLVYYNDNSPVNVSFVLTQLITHLFLLKLWKLTKILLKLILEITEDEAPGL